MKKIVYSFLLLFIIGVVGTLVSVSASGGFSLDTYNIHDEVIVDQTDISNIEINISSSDVTIHPTAEDKITAKLSGKISKKLKEKLTLSAQESGDNLIIELQGAQQIKLNVGVLIVDTNVDVYLPTKLYDTVNVRTSSGDIDISDVQSKELLLESSSGDIKAKDLESDDHVIQASSGELELTHLKGPVLANTSSGDISIRCNSLTGDILANASSGDITVQFDKKPTSLSLQFSGGSGEGIVTLDGINYQEKSEHHILGTIGNGQHHLTVNTSSGDFYLK